VFVNCKGNAWYQLGINDEFDSIDKCTQLFRRLIDHFTPRQSLAVGMSMGGYAATVFGLLLQLDYVTAFTPEVILDLPHCRSVTLNNVRRFDFKYISLQHLLAANSHTIVNAIYGAYDLIDLSLLWPLSHILERAEGKLRVTFCNDGHQVPLSLDVRNLVKSTFSVGCLEPRDIRAAIVLRTAHPAVELYALARARHFKNVGDFNAVHDVLTGEPSFSKVSWINFFLAENFDKAGEFDRAAAQFDLAATQDPGSFYVWFRSAQFAERTRRFDMLSYTCERALAIKPGDVHASKLFAKALAA
jgi:hypothetical protein